MRQRDTILIVDDMEINRVILDGLFRRNTICWRLRMGSRPCFCCGSITRI